MIKLSSLRPRESWVEEIATGAKGLVISVNHLPFSSITVKFPDKADKHANWYGKSEIKIFVDPEEDFNETKRP